MSEITLYDLDLSPNNMKVRIAMNYKGIPFEKIVVDFMDRAIVVEASGQPLTPVIKHGDSVVYDSRAILRYLDANFRDTPPLFSADRARMQELESEESAARDNLGAAAGMVFQQALSESPDLGPCAEASQKINDATAAYEERLAQHEFLMGDQMTVVDVTAAPYVFYAMLPPDAGGPDNPLGQFFIDNFSLGDGRDKTREWAGKVMSYDR